MTSLCDIREYLTTDNKRNTKMPNLIHLSSNLELFSREFNVIDNVTNYILLLNVFLFSPS